MTYKSVSTSSPSEHRPDTAAHLSAQLDRIEEGQADILALLKRFDEVLTRYLPQGKSGRGPQLASVLAKLTSGAR